MEVNFLKDVMEQNMVIEVVVQWLRNMWKRGDGYG